MTAYVVLGQGVSKLHAWHGEGGSDVTSSVNMTAGRTSSACPSRKTSPMFFRGRWRRNSV
jgi:hypothetical protein